MAIETQLSAGSAGGGSRARAASSPRTPRGGGGRHGWIAVFVAKRLLMAIPLLLGVVIVNFCLIQLAPGDPVTVLIGDYPADPDYVAQIRAQYGLDQGIGVQLLRYLSEIFQGNLGVSYTQREAVLTLIVGRLGATLKLMLTAMILAIVVGSIAGIIAARFAGGWLDRLIQTLTLGGFSVPEFWFGQLLILFFAINLGVLPVSGAAPIRGGDGFLDTLPYLVLPAIALSMRYVALIARMTRISLIEVSEAPYVTAARSRGLSGWRILARHTYKNASPSIVAVIGFNLGYVLAGSVMIETVFAWPGIGRLLYDSIAARDYPVMTGVLLLISLTVVIANILTDLAQMLIDPRIPR